MRADPACEACIWLRPRACRSLGARQFQGRSQLSAKPVPVLVKVLKIWPRCVHGKVLKIWPRCVHGKEFAMAVPAGLRHSSAEPAMMCPCVWNCNAGTFCLWRVLVSQSALHHNITLWSDFPTTKTTTKNHGAMTNSHKPMFHRCRWMLGWERALSNITQALPEQARLCSVP